MIRSYSAFPEMCISPEEIFTQCGCDPQFQREKLGIFSRRRLGKHEKPLDVACKACEKLFAAEHVSPDAIDVLLVVSQTPERLLPQSASILQDRLGMKKDGLCALDLPLGCSGFVYALSVAKGLMLAEGLSSALIVTCDCYSRIVNPADRDTASIFGDAATATLIRDAHILGKTHFGTDGSGATHLWLRDNGFLYMNGRAVFNFMMRRVAPSIKECLQKNTLSQGDIDFFLLHQPSKFLLDTIKEKLQLPDDKVPMRIAQCANTVSSSIPLLLEELQETVGLSGKKLLLSGFGVGFSWATTVVDCPVEAKAVVRGEI